MTIRLEEPPVLAPLEVAPPPHPVSPPRRRRSRKAALYPYALIAPAVVAELLIHIVPMVLGVSIAFRSLDQLTIRNWLQTPFIGFANFVQALDPDGPIGSALFASLGRTVLYVVLVLGISWLIAMIAALLLQKPMPGRGALRVLFLVPYALPAFISTIAWAFMFNQRDGMVNTLLVDTLHLMDERPFWLIGDNAFFVIVIVSIWQMWPFAFLMLTAALQSLPHDVYEAAALDGASRWRQFWSITLPMIRPSNTVLVLVLGLWLFNMFTVPYVLFGGSPPESATLISPLIYKYSFVNWNFGLGAAVSVLLLLVLLVISVVYVKVQLPKEEDR